MARQWSIFLNSVFFVLGFSLVFSLVGVLLQSVLLRSSFAVQQWLGYAGGAVIIVFGIYLLGLIKIPFLEREHKLKVSRQFRFSYITSFVFGAAFAVGWTPCVGAVLGGILTLAVVHPASAFGLLLSYSVGLGVPFLLVGVFTQRASGLITKFGPKLKYVNYVFGVFLILLGILVFTNNLSRVASFSFLTDWLLAIDAVTGGSSSLNYGIAFVAGLGSFLSPCVMPLIPGFLTYLASTAINGKE
ncbi:cytochrome C biogenesis protein [Candidatus Woesearchaeota archaeon]|nr:cytochrome C biogenesis protein [Candidatus Woesearchaeota archaeon]